MYPEGRLTDPKGKLLIHFHKDEISKKTRPTGYIDKWNALDSCPKTIKSQKIASANEAISQWIQLTENGWRCIEINIEEEKAA